MYSEFWKKVDGKFNDPDRRAAEYVLALGGGVFVHGVERAIHAEAELPREPFQVTCVMFYGPAMWNGGKVSEAGWAHFKGCKSLTILSGWYVPVSETGLVQF